MNSNHSLPARHLMGKVTHSSDWSLDWTIHHVLIKGSLMMVSEGWWWDPGEHNNSHCPGHSSELVTGSEKFHLPELNANHRHLETIESFSWWGKYWNNRYSGASGWQIGRIWIVYIKIRRPFFEFFMFSVSQVTGLSSIETRNSVCKGGSFFPNPWNWVWPGVFAVCCCLYCMDSL